MRKVADLKADARYGRVFSLWRERGQVWGDGCCEWCGARLYVGRARQLASGGYILECVRWGGCA